MGVSYRECRLDIRDGDDALFRNGGLIAATGQGPWTHAAKCFWFGNTLLLAEVREWYGGRCVTLSSQVKKYPGRIDIFRPKCRADTAKFSAELLCRLAGHEYGWANIWRLGFSRLPLLRLLSGWRPKTWDMKPTPFGEPMICSQAVIWCERAAGQTDSPTKFLPCPHKGDRWVTPDDIGFSGDHELKFEGLMPGTARWK